MINAKVQEALNAQINKELYSAYLYLSMSAHFEAQSLPGFAKWTRMQADEEKEHALRIFDFIVERSGRVTLKAIDQPPSEWGSPLEVFEVVLEHEKKVTQSIHELYALAIKENDYATQVMLQWFINEQVEEEANASLMVEQLRMAADHRGIILHLDRHAGKREEEE